MSVRRPPLSAPIRVASLLPDGDRSTLEPSGRFPQLGDNEGMDNGDPLAGLVGFATALRAAGLPAGPQRVQAYLDAVERVDVADVGQLYWAGRVTLGGDPDALPRYADAVAPWLP